MREFYCTKKVFIFKCLSYNLLFLNARVLLYEKSVHIYVLKLQLTFLNARVLLYEKGVQIYVLKLQLTFFKCESFIVRKKCSYLRA